MEFNGVTYSNKRELIKAAIEAGGQTIESLCELAGVDQKGLSSQFAYLRLTGVYPNKGEDGKFTLITKEEFEAKRGERKPAVALTPAQILEKAEKREKRAAAAVTTAQGRYDKDANRENELRLAIAKAELELASILLGKVSSGDADASDEIETDSVGGADDDLA